MSKVDSVNNISDVNIANIVNSKLDMLWTKAVAKYVDDVPACEIIEFLYYDEIAEYVILESIHRLLCTVPLEDIKSEDILRVINNNKVFKIDMTDYLDEQITQTLNILNSYQNSGRNE